VPHKPFRVLDPRETGIGACPTTRSSPFPTNDGALPASVATQKSELIRIIVADGCANFRAGLCNLLTPEENFRVVARAADGEEVLEVIEEYRPDILLLDLCIPGSDGLTTLKKLWESQTKTKVIVLAASKDKNQFVQAMKFGARGIIMKQTGTELLIKSIRKLHAGEIWLDSDTMVAVMRQFSSRMEPTPPSSREEDRVPLSQRELEIVTLVTQGFRNKEIAQKLSISEQTVKNHMHNIFDKLAVSDRLELALYAVHQNIRKPV
jgi:two-component system nitrate/nitrite response regulator NarL